MPRYAIVADTGDLIALAPADDPERVLPLPEGLPSHAVVLNDTEAAKLATPDCRFTVDANGTVTATAVVVAPPPPDLAQKVSSALEQIPELSDASKALLAQALAGG